jgi:hypothetical protein
MIGNHRWPRRVWMQGWVAAKVAFALAEKE